MQKLTFMAPKFILRIWKLPFEYETFWGDFQTICKLTGRPFRLAEDAAKAEAKTKDARRSTCIFSIFYLNEAFEAMRLSFYNSFLEQPFVVKVVSSQYAIFYAWISWISFVWSSIQFW